MLLFGVERVRWVPTFSDKTRRDNRKVVADQSQGLRIQQPVSNQVPRGSHLDNIQIFRDLGELLSAVDTRRTLGDVGMSESTAEGWVPVKITEGQCQSLRSMDISPRAELRPANYPAGD